jgi:hypothetical protein
MKKRLLSGLFAMTLISGIAFANPALDDSVQKDEPVAVAVHQLLLKSSGQRNDTYSKLFGNNEGSMMKVNLSCGIAPIPPIGCRVGACVCNQYGQNCQWTFVCG